MHCIYPEEDSEKGSCKLQGKPTRDVFIDIVVISCFDEVPIVKQDHPQCSEEQHTDECSLLVGQQSF